MDYIIKLVKFPVSTVKECVTPNSDGTYTILVNKDIAFNQQKKAVLHAIQHIENNDFYTDHVSEIERLRHETTQRVRKRI